jgi:prepilin-type N-terminal cleavage/methylation domain-containing protein
MIKHIQGKKEIRSIFARLLLLLWQKRRKIMKKTGFTLIELLVVIAIIALLMGILMPALSKVKDRAKSIHCVNNVRNLAMAWFMYQDENDGKLVHGNVPASPKFKEYGQPYWVEPPQDIAGVYTGHSDPTVEDEKRGIERGHLFPFIKDVDSYRCPSDDRKRTNKATFRSFSIAGGMNGEEGTDAVKKYTEIVRPATKYVFVEEADPRKWNMGSWLLYPSGNNWCDPLTVWHGGSSTLGWADGRAEMHRWRDERTIDMYDVYIQGNWSPSHPDSVDLMFMQRGYQLTNSP